MSEAPKMLGPYKYHGEYLLVPESDIERMQAENAALKLSRILCHWYAGCTADNCKLDGENCAPLDLPE